MGHLPAAGAARFRVATVTPALVAEIRYKRYARARGAQPHIALAGLSLQVAAGEFVALVGPSGCGKTTFLNIVAGLDRDFDGELRLAPRADGAPARVGYVFQEPRLLPWRTVRENIALVLPPHRADVIVQDLLNAVGLPSAPDLYPLQLSVGMSRRVSIARAFAIVPDLLLMDEPFVSLDHDTVEQLRDLLLKLWHARPTTVLFVTHDIREALVLADRLVLLSGTPGRVLADVPVGLARHRRHSSADIEVLRDEILRRHRELIGAAATATPVE
ncbi:MAG TPA: ABC transporter ATP-binding protein [Steroidobacteraceae bacterium]